jgi:hypothetical protein
VTATASRLGMLSRIPPRIPNALASHEAARTPLTAMLAATGRVEQLLGCQGGGELRAPVQGIGARPVSASTSSAMIVMSSASAKLTRAAR